MGDRYNYKNCVSLFGYASDVHIRSGGICEYCGCGKGDNVDFDMWRQMSVEHLIGRSQKGDKKDIKELLNKKFPRLTKKDIEKYTHLIDTANTITACRFCNSMTSRVKNKESMDAMILEGEGEPSELVARIIKNLKGIHKEKKKIVDWKLSSVRDAFNTRVRPKLDKARNSKT